MIMGEGTRHDNTDPWPRLLALWICGRLGRGTSHGTVLCTIQFRYTTDFQHMMTSSNGKCFASLAICAGKSPVIGEFPTQRPATRSFDVFFDL